jgi:hypothetical protein
MTERTVPPDETKKGAPHYVLREGRLVMTTTSGIHCLGPHAANFHPAVLVPRIPYLKVAHPMFR